MCVLSEPACVLSELACAAFLIGPPSYRYCRMLEEGSFRGRTADFVFMFLFGGFLMTVSFSGSIEDRQAQADVDGSFSAHLPGFGGSAGSAG